MNSNHGRWFFSVVRFLRNQFTKPLGPSLGVNWMWTKRSNHASKNECAKFCNICPKRAILKKNIQIWPFSCLQNLFLQKKNYKFIKTTFFCHGPLPTFLYQCTFFASPTANHVGPCQWIIHGLKYVFWGPWNPWSLWHFFPQCKLMWSYDEFMVHGVNIP